VSGDGKEFWMEVGVGQHGLKQLNCFLLFFLFKMNLELIVISFLD
jgi:hypothetical protein